MLGNQAPAPPSDQLLLKVEALEQKCDLLQASAALSLAIHVPENKRGAVFASENMGTSKEKDLEYVQSLMDKLPINDKVVKLVFRIENFVQGKCRPLKVVCNSSNMAKAVLKN